MASSIVHGRSSAWEATSASASSSGSGGTTLTGDTSQSILIAWGGGALVLNCKGDLVIGLMRAGKRGLAGLPSPAKGGLLRLAGCSKMLEHLLVDGGLGLRGCGSKGRARRCAGDG